MANEIKALEGSADGIYRVLFLYPIAAPEQVGGANVVPTPAPTEGLIANLLDATETAALNDGTAAYEVVSYGPSPGKTTADMVSELRALYADRLAEYLAAYDVRYKYVGAEVDA